jgi:hypothetical protein
MSVMHVPRMKGTFKKKEADISENGNDLVSSLQAMSFNVLMRSTSKKPSNCTEFGEKTFHVLDDVYSKTFLLRLRKDMLCAMEDTRGISSASRGTKRIQYDIGKNRFSKHTDYEKLKNAPKLLHCIAEMMKTNDFVCASVSLLRTLPESNAQEWHTDVDDLFDDSKLQERLPSYLVTAFIPLQNVNSLDIGPTEFREAQFPFVTTNQVLLFDGTVWHRGTANTSHTTNDKMMLVFKRPWFNDLNDIQPTR